MKVQIQSKKGLKTILSISVEKKIIQLKLNEKLTELQKQVQLKGFRPGKVPVSVIKNQFGKAAYGEVIDKLLRDTSSKAIAEKKIRIAGQPKIDLKTFGEGKDLNYELQVDCLPEIKLTSPEKYKITEYKLDTDKLVVQKKIDEMVKNYKNFVEKKENEKSIKNDQITFNYKATIDGKSFEGNEGKGIKLELGKDLFLKGFDEQLIGLKKKDKKIVKSKMPSNHPNKELAEKIASFECEILAVKKPEASKADNEFAKNMGAKDLNDLKNIIEKQISSQYLQALSSITKKEIFDQLEKLHKIDLPQNLIDSEISIITKSQKKEDFEKNKEKNFKTAKSRIKLGLILNEYGEQNKIKVEDIEIRNEIQKQVQGMPGQEKMILDYYRANPQASQNLKGSLYEEKIINFIKTKSTIQNKTITLKEADKIISKFNSDQSNENDPKSKKISKVKDKKEKISKK